MIDTLSGINISFTDPGTRNCHPGDDAVVGRPHGDYYSGLNREALIDSEALKQSC
jgi:hypothetical protein